MILLGDCCTTQYRKTQYRKTHKSIISNSLVILFTLLAVLLPTATAQQTSLHQARVQLELVSHSSRMVHGGSGSSNSQTAQIPQVAIDEAVNLRVTSQCDCFVYLFNFDTQGNIHDLTNINNNFQRLGTTHNFPTQEPHYVVQGPIGLESIFAIASQRPLQMPRLQQLVHEQVQSLTGQGPRTLYGASNNARGLINGGGIHTGHPAQLDGWLAGNIIVDVTAVQAQYQAPTHTAPAHTTTQPPVNTQINQAPSQPAAQPTPANPPTANGPATNPATSNVISGGYCSLAGLTLTAPNGSQGFHQRCVKKSFDGNFESTASMYDVIVHFGTELVNKGFSFQETTHYTEVDSRAHFTYQGKSYQMRIERVEQFFRFELLEFNPQAFNR